MIFSSLHYLLEVPLPSAILPTPCAPRRLPPPSALRPPFGASNLLPSATTLRLYPAMHACVFITAILWPSKISCTVPVSMARTVVASSKQPISQWCAPPRKHVLIFILAYNHGRHSHPHSPELHRDFDANQTRNNASESIM